MNLPLVRTNFLVGLSSCRWMAVGFCLVLPLTAATTADSDLDRHFQGTVRPFLKTYCTTCHSGATPAATFDVQKYSTVASVVNDLPHWSLVLGKISSNQMPPKAVPQPTSEMRKDVIEWIEAVRRNEASKRVGDPGPVLARRLSNSEYNYTIRDLTGVDLRPAREFPVDPANQAGFDNSGESLDISPALLSKYLDAARQVADHLVLKPDGIGFASHPMLVETDREKYPIQRIVAFYDSQPTDFADYFERLWVNEPRRSRPWPANPRYRRNIWLWCGMLWRTPGKT